MASTIVAPTRHTPAPRRIVAPAQRTPTPAPRTATKPAPRTATPPPLSPPRQQQAGTPPPNAARGPVVPASGADGAASADRRWSSGSTTVKRGLPRAETEVFRKALRQMNKLQANIEAVLADLDRLQVSVSDEACAPKAAKEEFSAGKRALRNLFARKARWRNLCLTKEARRARPAADRAVVAGAAAQNAAVAEGRHLSTASSNDGPNSSASWE